MICEQTRIRIKLSVAAYAYEVLNDPIMSDDEFDHLSLKVNLNAKTTRPDMDEWFTTNFSPDTGMWVRNHPEPEGLLRIYKRLTTKSRWESIILLVA